MKQRAGLRVGRADPMIGEEEVLRALRDIAGRRDPVPDNVLAAARASIAWRDPDAALARLTADSAGAAAGRGPRWRVAAAAVVLRRFADDRRAGHDP